MEKPKNTEKEVKAEEASVQLQFDEAMEKLTNHIQTNVNADANQKQQEQTPAEPEPPQPQQQRQETNVSITPEMINLEQIQRHLSIDLPADGATQEQMAASFIKLLNLTAEQAPASGSTVGDQGSQLAMPPRPAPPTLPGPAPVTSTKSSETLAITGEGGKGAGRGSEEDQFVKVAKAGKPAKLPRTAERSTSGDRRARSHSPRR